MRDVMVPGNETTGFEMPNIWKDEQKIKSKTNKTTCIRKVMVPGNETTGFEMPNIWKMNKMYKIK